MPLRNDISKQVDEFKEVLNEAKILSPKLENDNKNSMENIHQSSPMIMKSPPQNNKTKSPMKKFSENSREIPMKINANDSKAQSAGKFTNNIFVHYLKSLQTKKKFTFFFS